MKKRTMRDFINVVEYAELMEYDHKTEFGDPDKDRGPMPKRMLHQKNTRPSSLTFEGTRLSVYEIAEYAEHDGIDFVLESWPDLNRVDVEAAMRYAQENPRS